MVIQGSFQRCNPSLTLKKRVSTNIVEPNRTVPYRTIRVDHEFAALVTPALGKFSPVVPRSWLHGMERVRDICVVCTRLSGSTLPMKSDFSQSKIHSIIIVYMCGLRPMLPGSTQLS